MSEQRESHLRSILKGLSWRVIASVTIAIIAYERTGNFTLALEIAGIEFFIKFILYYGHERLWQQIPRGKVRQIFKKKS